MLAGSRLLRDARTRTFDVICAGEPQWKLASEAGPIRKASGKLPLRPGGGATSVALALARAGLRVGLASNLPLDDGGRSYREQLAAAGVDVEGVTLAVPRSTLLVVDGQGQANPFGSHDEQRLPFEVPAGWSSHLLLLSGLSPVVSHAAALCKAARAARSAGAFVLLDVNASLHMWAGRDPRTIRMVLREVSAVRCSLADLAVIGLDLSALRGAVRPDAIFVVGDAKGGAVASGPFGEVAFVPPVTSPFRTPGTGDAITTALCTEFARAGVPGESAGARWHRALQRGHTRA